MFEANAAKEQMKKSGISRERLGYSNSNRGCIEGCEAEAIIINDDDRERSIQEHGRAVRSGAGGGADIDSTVSGLVLQYHILTILRFMGHKLAPLRLAAVDLAGQCLFIARGNLLIVDITQVLCSDKEWCAPWTLLAT